LTRAVDGAGCLGLNVVMAEPLATDDIKIIAQFLAERAGASADWPQHKNEAFKLRQQLKLRGGYKLVKADRRG
jgi:hypothetical protein